MVSWFGFTIYIIACSCFSFNFFVLYVTRAYESDNKLSRLVTNYRILSFQATVVVVFARHLQCLSYADELLSVVVKPSFFIVIFF